MQVKSSLNTCDLVLLSLGFPKLSLSFFLSSFKHSPSRTLSGSDFWCLVIMNYCLSKARRILGWGITLCLNVQGKALGIESFSYLPTPEEILEFSFWKRIFSFPKKKTKKPTLFSCIVQTSFRQWQRGYGMVIHKLKWVAIWNIPEL